MSTAEHVPEPVERVAQIKKDIDAAHQELHHISAQQRKLKIDIKKYKKNLHEANIAVTEYMVATQLVREPVRILGSIHLSHRSHKSIVEGESINFVIHELFYPLVYDTPSKQFTGFALPHATRGCIIWDRHGFGSERAARTDVPKLKYSKLKENDMYKILEISQGQYKRYGDDRQPIDLFPIPIPAYDNYFIGYMINPLLTEIIVGWIYMYTPADGSENIIGGVQFGVAIRSSIADCLHSTKMYTVNCKNDSTSCHSRWHCGLHRIRISSVAECATYW